ncbi:Putative_endonuclease V [Hexamita inflata]|uniref:Endonuclease V n=1 Tax=Hexamita inflata TaxID=28002 RepID=A0AA86U1J2_9EUKA|nr:Putative endonuclease V [Hexamita inflata]
MLTHNIVRQHSLPCQKLDFSLFFALDISYSLESENDSVVVCTVYKNNNHVKSFAERSVPPAGYVPGFLSMREFSPVFNLIEKVKKQFVPTLIVLDGCGRWHPYRAGLACYISLALGIPTIGVSKNYLQIEATNMPMVETSKQNIQDFFNALNSPENQPAGKLKYVERDGFPPFENYHMETYQDVNQLHFRSKDQSGKKRYYCSLGFQSENEQELLKQVIAMKDTVLGAIRVADLSGRAVLGISGFKGQVEWI